MHSLKQSIFERRNFHFEMDRTIQKKMNKYYLHINSNTKEKIMENILNNWSLEDLNTLKKNRKRPVPELVRILKDRYTFEEVQNMKNRILSDLELSRRPKTSANSKLSDQDFRLLYENHDKEKQVRNEALKVLESKISVHTIRYYVDAIRAEIKGYRTSLPQHFYDLIRLWYNGTHVPQLPVRGSLGARADVKRKLTKKGIVVKDLEPSQQKVQPETSPEEAPVVSEEVSEPSQEVSKPSQEVSIPTITKTPFLDPKDLGFTAAAEFKFGLLLCGDLKIVVDSLAHVEGAERVYRQLGITSDLKRVRILMETLD